MAFRGNPYQGKVKGASKGKQGGGTWDWNTSWEQQSQTTDWDEDPWSQGGKPGLGGKAYQHGKGKGWQNGWPSACWAEYPTWGKGKQDEPEAEKPEKPEKLDPREEEWAGKSFLGGNLSTSLTLEQRAVLADILLRGSISLGTLQTWKGVTYDAFFYILTHVDPEKCHLKALTARTSSICARTIAEEMNKTFEKGLHE